MFTPSGGGEFAGLEGADALERQARERARRPSTAPKRPATPPQKWLEQDFGSDLTWFCARGDLITWQRPKPPAVIEKYSSNNRTHKAWAARSGDARRKAGTKRGTHAALGDKYLRAGQHELAARSYAQAVSLGGVRDAALVCKAARAAYAVWRFGPPAQLWEHCDAALVQCEAALAFEANRARPELWFECAQLYVGAGRLAAALRVLSALIDSFAEWREFEAVVLLCSAVQRRLGGEARAAAALSYLEWIAHDEAEDVDVDAHSPRAKKAAKAARKKAQGDDATAAAAAASARKPPPAPTTPHGLPLWALQLLCAHEHIAHGHTFDALMQVRERFPRSLRRTSFPGGAR